MSVSFLSDTGRHINATEKAIVKFFVCKKKLDTFTEDELNALPKAFLVYVAANAVKEIWEKVPRVWTQDPVLSELQPCSLYEHHQQVRLSKIPSVRQCRTCQLIKLYHGHKSDPTSFVNTYHGCEEQEQASAEKDTSWTEEEACWAWTHQ